LDGDASSRWSVPALNPKHESESLINALLPLAKQMLRRYGEFYPYGGYMKLNGEIVQLGADDPDMNRPKSRDLIYILRSSLQEIAHTKQCKVGALVFDVKVNLPKDNRKSDAIQISVEHAGCYSADIFFPYQIVDGEVVYAEAFAQEGQHDIFG
jgi:hypothetical protein